MRIPATASVIMFSMLWGSLGWAQPSLSHEQRVFTTDADFALGSFEGTRARAPESDQLRIDTGARQAPFLWVAGASNGTVTKVDTRTGRQVARYDSVLTQNWDGSMPPVRTPRDACNTAVSTAVDAQGDVFVFNRANCNGAYAAVTKYAGSLAACVDRNGSGVINTSTDANGDGTVNTSDPAEFIGQLDECVLWTKTFAVAGEQGRALVVDSEQNVWVSTMASKLYRLHGQSGAVLKTINVGAETGVTTSIMQSLAVGPGGFLYASDTSSQRLVRKIDPNGSAGSHVVDALVTPVPTFGITVSRDGVVWLGAESDSTSGVVRVDFAARTAQVVGGGGGCVGRTRGITVDPAGEVWAACWAANRLLRVSSSGSFLGSWVVGSRPEGVTVAADRKIWVVNNGSDSLSVLNPAAPSPQQTFPGGGQSFTASDMTGFNHHQFVQRQGTWRVVHDSGQLQAHWGTLTWNQEPQGATPPGTRITVLARAADTQAALPSRPFTQMTSGQTVTGIDGRFLEVEVRLASSNFSGEPVFSDLTIAPYNNAPEALCQDRNVCAVPTTCNAQVSVDNGSYDPDGDAITRAQSPAGPYAIGTRPVSLTVSDPTLSDSCSASVRVRDCEPPAITCALPVQAECTGNGAATVALGGAQATDSCSAVSVSGPGAGSYPLGTTPLAYTATDAEGNTAACTTRVLVVDTQAPALALNGANPMRLECKQGGYVEPGATALDTCSGPLSDGAIVIEQPVIDPAVLANHAVTYRATDSAGNVATAVRQVQVQDSLPPEVTLNGSATVRLECKVDTYSEAGAVASDVCSGNLPVTLLGTVDPNVLGDQPVRYRAQDAHGLVTQKVRDVRVVDTLPPTLTLGADPTEPVECSRGAFIDLGAAAHDSCAGDISHRITLSGTQNITTPGIYPITYGVTDLAGNAAPSITRNVNVKDTQAPVITMRGVANQELECGVDTYTELGATAYDACQGDLTSSLQTYGNGANTTAVGTYSIEYGVWDATGNTRKALRTVKVSDRLPPVLTLVGSATMQHECASGVFVDPSATAADLCYGNLTPSIQRAGFVNAWTLGTYPLTYNVQDSALLSATPITRTVHVVDTQGPTLDYRQVAATPADHTLRSFTLSDCVTANDSCDGWANANNGTILSIYSDEPEDAADSSDGSTAQDIVITGKSSFQLRAERQEGGNGRVYGVRFELKDLTGNTRGGLCRILVPASEVSAAEDNGAGAGYSVSAPPPSVASLGAP